MEMYSNIVEVYEDYYTSKSNISTVADQQEYTLPTDLFKIRRVEINYNVSDTNSKPQRAIPVLMDSVLRDLENNSMGLTVNSNAVFYVRGSLIGFIPIPTRTGTNAITLWYIATPSELSSSSDVINIPFPDRYAQLISLGAAATLLRKGQQEESVATRYLQEYNTGLAKMKQELEDRIADWSKGVVDTLGYDVDFTSFSGSI